MKEFKKKWANTQVILLRERAEKLMKKKEEKIEKKRARLNELCYNLWEMEVRNSLGVANERHDFELNNDYYWRSENTGYDMITRCEK